ncbi:MAG: DMT family transporter [Pseudomonadota bacterium]
MTESLIPLGLCLLSAITVAATNMFVKRGGDVLSARMIVSLAMAFSVLPFVFFVPTPSGSLWGALALSVVVHWGYQFAMIRALHRGDLSLVFPVMRGLAPLLSALMALALLKENPGLWGWLGLILATCAIIVFALPERQADGTGLPKKEALIWAALTALGIAAYSVVDANGVRLTDELLGNPMTFVVWLFLFDWIGITAAMFWVRRGQIWVGVKPQILSGTVGGFLGTVSYGAALWAMSMADVAYVTAIRETSVVFAAIMGALFLKESFGKRRIGAAAVLSIGLLMLQIGA